MSAMENNEQLWEVEAAPEANGVPMADWWRRFAALVIDVARRYLAPMLLFLIPILGLFGWVADGVSALWDRRRQPVHDKLAGSVVVSAR